MLGSDGLSRCPWGAGGDEYRVYHDAEWGRPVTDDAGLLERLCLEGFQSGLSWLRILRKRAGFRVGIVNDHLEGCHAREVVERARAVLIRPGPPCR